MIFDYPLIHMPDSLDRVKRLQMKLKEYKQRLHDIDRADSKEKKMLVEDTTYKIKLLETLLLEGEVNTSKLWANMGYEKGSDRNTYVDVCAVIHDYCRTGGKQVEGGTGL